jgi:nucleotide-binding universal stress UspA family protein
VKILHATDFSEVADHARAEAVRLARAFGAEVVLLHALPAIVPPVEVSPEVLIDTIAKTREAAEVELARRVEQVREAGVPASARVVDGEPVHEIVRSAEDEDFDYVVLGTHGRKGIVARLVLGSVAGAVVREAPCPVLTVREARKGRRKQVA